MSFLYRLSNILKWWIYFLLKNIKFIFAVESQSALESYVMIGIWQAHIVVRAVVKQPKDWLLNSLSSRFIHVCLRNVLKPESL